MQLIWNKYSKLFNARKLRERIIISLMAVVAVYFVWEFFILGSMRHQKQQIQNRYDALSQNLISLSAEEKLLTEALKRNPNAKKKREIVQLETRLLELDRELKALSMAVISSDKLPVVMQEIIKKRPNLSLIGVQTLPEEEIYFGREKESVFLEPDTISVLSDIKEGGTSTDADMYKHGVKVKFRGRYFDVLTYLKDLESSEWKIYWDEIDYSVDNYPEATIQLTAFTLSTQKGMFDGG